MIRLTNLDRLANDLTPFLVQAQARVLTSGQVMLGKFTQELELELYCSSSDLRRYSLNRLFQE